MSPSATPPDAAVLPVLEWLVSCVDLRRASLRSIMDDLSDKFGGHDFTDRKGWIREQVMGCLQKRAEAEGQAASTSDGGAAGKAEQPASVGPAESTPPKKRKKRTSKADAHSPNQLATPSPPRTVQTPLRFRGLMAPLMLSPELSAICDDEPILPQPWVLKKLHAYARVHQLKDPHDGRRLLLDDALRRVLGDHDGLSFFGLNKHLQRHMRSAERCTEEERQRLEAWRQEWESKGLMQNRKEHTPTSARSRKRQRLLLPEGDEEHSDKKGGAAERTASQSDKPSSPAPPSGISQPMCLSAALREVCGGARQLSRCGVVKALWQYIKEHQLQDTTDKRVILCDDKLKQVFNGESRVTAFNMNKYLKWHLFDPATAQSDVPE
ncbi:hypothetical protein CDCA_CDCA07G2225 [Cyanidium caldarium]|uniref:Uncharacterized protein n=1 Tax=Cyanidium caldarium TaxID=2771 RepID=A0AAV9IVQ6_CYACA|nr:hypothetical protein CDCA_CDCA07G2225 [Cyanidium caldarium]